MKYISVVMMSIIAAAMIGVPAVSGSFNASQSAEIVDIVKTAALNGTSFWNPDQGQYVSDLGNITLDNDANITTLQGTAHQHEAGVPIQDIQPVTQPVDPSSTKTLNLNIKEGSFSGDNLRGLAVFDNVNVTADKMAMTNDTGASFVGAQTIEGSANIGGNPSTTNSVSSTIEPQGQFSRPDERFVSARYPGQQNRFVTVDTFTSTVAADNVVIPVIH